jgi:hypothetical protein
MRNSFFRCTLVAAGIAAANIASAAPGGEILEFGYYEVQSDGQRYEDQGTTSGVIQAGPTVKLLQQTDVIPIEAGRLFGFRFRLKGFSGKEDIEIREVVTHPPMTRPGQKTSTGFETKLPLIVRHGELSEYAGYSFNHDYEMVEGDWRFEFFYDDKKLFEQKFKTVKH